MVSFPYESNLKDFEFLENTGWDYSIALARLFLFIGVIFVFKFVLLGRLNNWVDAQDRFDRVQHLPEAVDSLISLKFAGLSSFYLSTLDLSLPATLRFLLDFLVLFLVFWFVLKALYLLVENITRYQVDKEPGSKHLIEFFKLIVKLLIFLIVGLWFLSLLDVDITAYLAGLSVLGLALAFALQNVIADLFATVVLYFDKPFEIGDSIKLGDYTGTVETIGIRSTQVRLPTGTLLIISNRDLSGQRIENTKNREERRVTVVLGVRSDIPVKKLKQIPITLEKIVTSVENTRFARSNFTSIGDYSLRFELVYYITTPNYSDYLIAQDSINYQILENFEKDGIAMPYPTQTVVVEQSTKAN